MTNLLSSFTEKLSIFGSKKASCRSCSRFQGGSQIRRSRSKASVTCGERLPALSPSLHAKP